MGRGDYLGEFEQVVLLAVARLEDEAYGMRVREEIEVRAGRRTSIGAVYATLECLVGKGHARVYVFNHHPFKRTGKYKTSQRRARSHHLGLWGGC